MSYGLMMRKFDVCRSALQYHNHVLFLDSDIFFIFIENHILSDIHSNPNIAAIVSPHLSLDFDLESMSVVSTAVCLPLKSLIF